MRKYGFSLTRILPCKGRIYDSDRRFCPYTRECGSVKTHILAYFMQWRLQLCSWDKIFDCFSQLLPALGFQHFSVFYDIILKFLPLFLFWYHHFNNVRNFICHSRSRITGNRINVINVKLSATKARIKEKYLSRKRHVSIDNRKA